MAYNSQSPALAASQGFADKYLQAMMFRHQMNQQKINQQYRQSVLNLRREDLEANRATKQQQLDISQEHLGIARERLDLAKQPKPVDAQSAFLQSQKIREGGASAQTAFNLFEQASGGQYSPGTVSYTHLTLPTTPYV